MKDKIGQMIFQPSFGGRIKFFIINLILLYFSWKLISVISIIGWSLVLFFTFGFFLSIYRFLPGAYYLIIDENGFTTKYNFRKTEYKWDQIEVFFVKKIATKTAIVFNFSENDQKLKSLYRMGAELIGYEGMLPDNFGCKPAELCSLLEKYRKNYFEK